MKTNNILKLLALLSCSFIYAACEEELGGQDGPEPEETVIPNFPELIENYAVEPGSTQEIVFTPNLDWKVTIPSEVRQWFWIKDDSFKVAELTGSASDQPVTVQVGVTETPEFDKNFSCDVTHHLGDSSKVVAKYMLPAKEKTMQVYAAKLTADGGFEIAEDGVSYVYSEETATAFNLVWSATDCEFRLPVTVVSHCEWTVAVPEWAEVNVPETTTGVVELVLKGESNEGASGKVAFYNGETKLVELDASVPACGGIEVYSAKFENGEFAVTEDGEYAWSDTAVDNISLQWLGSDFRVPVKVSAKCNWTVVMPDWLAVELPEKTAGDVSLTFCGVPSKYPSDDTSSKILFKNGHPDSTNLYEKIGITIAALLLGEGDMIKTGMLALNAGFDTDCTCATAGAVLGFIFGAEAIIEKYGWSDIRYELGVNLTRRSDTVYDLAEDIALLGAYLNPEISGSPKKEFNFTPSAYPLRYEIKYENDDPTVYPGHDCKAYIHLTNLSDKELKTELALTGEFFSEKIDVSIKSDETKIYPITVSLPSNLESISDG